MAISLGRYFTSPFLLFTRERAWQKNFHPYDTITNIQKYASGNKLVFLWRWGVQLVSLKGKVKTSALARQKGKKKKWFLCVVFFFMSAQFLKILTLEEVFEKRKNYFYVVFCHLNAHKSPKRWVKFALLKISIYIQMWEFPSIFRLTDILPYCS